MYVDVKYEKIKKKKEFRGYIYLDMIICQHLMFHFFTKPLSVQYLKAMS